MRDDSRIGTVLADRYRIDSLLGSGGMGHVYAAEHVLMRKRVAVKVLHRELTVVPEVVARFEREAMAAANIDHPNVAGATDFGKLTDGSVFMVMEYVEGRNLRDEIAAGPMPVERATAIARQIASALASAHSLDIVHRDLKPENVMLVAKGADPDFVKVLDFGIARVPIAEATDGRDSPITKAGMVFGTPEYMAPEQALGQTVDGRADLYALGVIYYEMLAGVRPFVASSQTGVLGLQLSRPVPPFAERAPGLRVPPVIEQAIVRLLDREAAARFPNATAVVSAIDAALGALPAEPARLFTRIGGTDSTAIGPGSLPASRASRLDGPPAAPRSAGIAGGGPTAEVAARVEVAAGSLTTANAAAPSAVSPPGAEPPRALRFLVVLLDWIEVRRPLFPPPLKDVPSPFFLGASALLVLSATLGGITLGRSCGADAPRIGTTSSSWVPVATSAPPATDLEASPSAAARELEVAQRRGLDALREHVRRHPDRAPAQLALARVLAADRRFVEAVSALGRALELGPELHSAPEVEDVLRQSIADDQARKPAFTLLSGPMKSSGAEIIYSLATSDFARPEVRKQADELVRHPGFADRASPALAVVVRLRVARTCADVAGVLEAARTDGDARALRYLRSYLDTKGCKVRRRRVDCWPCLRGDRKLSTAISAIQARAGDAG
ncbi:MAG: protein kinase [Polyangiaceae bacterium]|nr:protein kinase [Polyangiaceae bacterium]